LICRFGFFIELGANDGVKQSNTLRLEVPHTPEREFIDYKTSMTTY